MTDMTLFWLLILTWFIILIVSGVYKRLWPAFLGASISLFGISVAVSDKICWWTWSLLISGLFMVLMVIFLVLDIRQARHEDESKKAQLILPKRSDKH